MELLKHIKSACQFFDSENQRLVREPFKQMERIYSDVYALVNRVGTASVENSQKELEHCLKERLSKVISLKEMFISNNQKGANSLDATQFCNSSIDFLKTVEYLLKPKKYIIISDICQNSLGDIFDAQQEIVDYSSEKSLLQLYREYSIHYYDKLTEHFKKVSNAYHLLMNKFYRNLKILIAIILIVVLVCFLWKFKLS